MRGGVGVRSKYCDEHFVLRNTDVYSRVGEFFGRGKTANRLSTAGWPRFPRDSDAAKCLGADVDYDGCYLKKTTSRSSRVAVVVSQQPAEPLVTLNFTVSLADFFAGFDELVAQPLVVSFAVIMGQVRGCGSSQ